jgi:tetratricopeptide (TPR) repeat protein
LAVGLFLIGLSLTVSGRGRYLLAIPGVGIAVICMIWAISITLGGITKVSDTAIGLTVEGQRLESSAPIDDTAAAHTATLGAIDKYKAAVADSPEFAVAWTRLADAEFESGVVPTPGSTFDSVSDRDATQRAVQAGEKAISLGASDPSVLSSIAFYHFLVGDYGRAADLAQQAVDANDRFPLILFNLGVVQVAQGDAGGARATYGKAIDLLRDPSFDGLRFDIIAAAFTDLEIAANDAPEQGDLAQEMKGLLAAEAARSDRPGDATVPDAAPSDSSVTDAAVNIGSLGFSASYNTDGFDPDTSLLNVWYYRPNDRNGEGPFVQAPNLDSFSTVGTNPVSTTPTENGDCFPGGDYRVDVYAGRDKVATADTHLNDSALGVLESKGGESNGFTLCVPTTWDVDEKVSNDRDTLAFTNSKDDSQFILAASFPSPGASDTGPQAVLDANLNSLATDLGVQLGPSTQGAELVGRTEGGANVTLNTTLVQGTAANGTPVLLIGSIDSDDVNRLVVLGAATPDDLETLRGELVPLVRFLGVPDTTTPSGG